MTYLESLEKEHQARSLGERLTEAYQRTRCVAGIWRQVDTHWQQFNYKLGVLKNPPAGLGQRPENSDAIKQLCEAMLADLNRWASDPSELLRPPPPPPEQPPHVIAQELIRSWRTKGVVLTAYPDGGLSAYPVSKLDASIKMQLARFKTALVTELNREVYFVP